MCKCNFAVYCLLVSVAFCGCSALKSISIPDKIPSGMGISVYPEYSQIDIPYLEKRTGRFSYLIEAPLSMPHKSFTYKDPQHTPRIAVDLRFMGRQVTVRGRSGDMVSLNLNNFDFEIHFRECAEGTTDLWPYCYEPRQE